MQEGGEAGRLRVKAGTGVVVSSAVGAARMGPLLIITHQGEAGVCQPITEAVEVGVRGVVAEAAHITNGQ